ncbi:hippocampus abundant transcript-like protein 1 isoform X2 [Jatropha curcas]|uniref:hippocampus abundant transcript-like protein 1 isoform X2 n=1 Tax=Jatropha curcas TaxID=180498 RepID=UPI0005FADB43|nr:hippocampus abundant transcript-like protein 1 isoform X2 [Jatropha curcas]
MEEKITCLSHLFATVFLSQLSASMVLPVITDVTMLALCPGQDHCSIAIYLSGFQQAMTGIGSVVITPIIGNLSDQYGRKAMLTIPLTVSIFPLAILAYSSETNFFYSYYVLRILTAMVSGSSIYCLALAYVADNISERQRASAFGILSGIALASSVAGILAARLLSTSLTFKVAAFVSMVAAVYMRIFLKDRVSDNGNLSEPILKSSGPEENIHQNDADTNNLSTRVSPVSSSNKILTVGDLICLLKRSLAEAGFLASLMYYLKARFHFSKNQYADLLLLIGAAGMVSQLIFMPLLAPIISEEKILSIGLFMGFINMLLYSIAWSNWVPYASTALTVFTVLVQPSLRSITSKQVGPDEQGKAQGCISSICSFASIISPLIFSPLTALFLSEEAPFKFPGFSISCIGFALLIGFIPSIMIKAPIPIPCQKNNSNSMEA